MILHFFQNLLNIISYYVVFVIFWHLSIFLCQMSGPVYLIIFYDFLTGVMLLSKDRQNLLKIISYDFIFVGIQVKDVKGKDLYQVQSYTSQLLYTFEKRCSPKPFGLTKNRLVFGISACTSQSKYPVLH